MIFTNNQYWLYLTAVKTLLTNIHHEGIIDEYRQWLQLYVDMIYIPTCINSFCSLRP